MSEIDEIEAFDITDAMITYGGGFVRELGMLLRRADAENRRKLFDAFPEYVERYREIAKEKKGQS